MRNISLTYIIAVIAVVSTATAIGNGGPQPLKLSDDIMERLHSMNNTSKIAEKLEVAGFSGLLSEFGPYTIFAPTNEAFSKFYENNGNNILANETHLNAILSYHIIEEEIWIQSYIYDKIETLQGEYISAHLNGDVRINDAKIIENYICSNGNIYVIDTLLMPENLSNSIDIYALTRSRPPITDSGLAAD